MPDWISIKDKIPEPKQPISARILYMGKIEQVEGCRSPVEPTVVLFDFYSGTGGDVIKEWKPRELPMKKDAHPYTSIQNKGL